MKKSYILIFFIVIVGSIIFIQCKTKMFNVTNTISKDKNEDIVLGVAEEFFKVFQNGDYESMKVFCTQNCIDTYFNDDDVWGIIWAKPISIGEEIRALSETEFAIFVTVDIKPVDSSLYGTEIANTSFYLIIQKQNDGKWLVDRFTTG